MKIPFHKYQGTGNDFILIDQRENQYLTKSDATAIRHLCDRRFGIGADGLILLELRTGYDFEMIYFNADGRQSSMCGNGGRCIVAFARDLGMIAHKCTFLAIDGPHEATISENDWIALKMKNVKSVSKDASAYVLDTGSPHYVAFIEDGAGVDVKTEGRRIRYSEAYAKTGINVNFVRTEAQGIAVATYERGVEDETLSCGTGVTAAAIAYAEKFPTTSPYRVPVSSKGGSLLVRFEKEAGVYKNIWLCGPAVKVFDGLVQVIDSQGKHLGET